MRKVGAVLKPGDILELSTLTLLTGRTSACIRMMEWPAHHLKNLGRGLVISSVHSVHIRLIVPLRPLKPTSGSISVCDPLLLSCFFLLML